jgi:glycosyltransferase involved in cell wall biosynthesis
VSSTSPILLLVSTLSNKSGGAETAFISLSDQLYRLGVNHYRANNGAKFLRSSDRWFTVPLARIYAKRGIPTIQTVILMLRSCINVLRVLTSVKPDLVNIHYIDTPSLYFFLFRRFFGYKIVLTSHGSDILLIDPAGTNLPTKFARWALESADAVSAVSPQVLDKAKYLLNGKVTATFLTPNGIDCSFWHLRNRKPRTQIIVSVGALVGIKGHDVLIKAFSFVRKNFPSVRLVIAGEGSSRNSLTMLAQRNGLNQAIKFAGECTPEQIRDLLADAAIFVMPSRSEGLPLAALEAMASGVPVIASNVGGLPSIIEHDVSGILVPPDCPKALAQAIEQLLKNADSARALAERAHDAAQSLSLTRMARTYHEMYLSVLGST